MLASFAGTVRKYLDATHAATVLPAIFFSVWGLRAFAEIKLYLIYLVYIYIWSVVWNIFFYVSIYWEESSQLTNIFQRGWNHQPYIYIYILIYNYIYIHVILIEWWYVIIISAYLAHVHNYITISYHHIISKLSTMSLCMIWRHVIIISSYLKIYGIYGWDWGQIWRCYNPDPWARNFTIHRQKPQGMF